MTERESWQVEGSAAEVYESQLVPAIFAEWAPRLVGAANVIQGNRILDVACGTGIVAREASTRIGTDGTVTGFEEVTCLIYIKKSF